MITIAIKESDTELLDGFPEYISFETDVPATVYYTLDGTDPTVESLIAIGNVYLPTLTGTLEVRAIAIVGDDQSDILRAVYENTSLDLGGPRVIGSEGIVVMRYDDVPVDSLGVSSDGSDAQEISVELGELDIKASRTNSGGEMISEGNKVFVKCTGKASGMDTMFGHFFEVADNNKISTMITYDDTLSMFNAMKK